MKHCKACKNEFEPQRPLQTVCGPKCAGETVRMLRKLKRADLKETRQKLSLLKPRSQWLKEAQTAFNAYIRERDAGKPCISCHRHHEGQWHAGHYLTVGAHPALRFDESNVHKQCAPCNTHLHGNLIYYRIGLLDRVGLEELQRLEGPHPPKKYTIQDLQELCKIYKGRLKELRK